MSNPFDDFPTIEEMRTRPNKVDRHRVEVMNDWGRVGGGLICDLCGFEIYDHPEVVGYSWLKRQCDGKLVKT